jgi:predicted RNA-binding protein YlqC (UPF0109 family)
VDEPDAVEVTEHHRRDRVELRLDVAERDMGKVIGKGGRIAHSLRSMLNVAGYLDGVRVSLDIGEPAPRRAPPPRRSGWR